MNRREQGFLLLTSHLGDPDRKPLTLAQFRTLATRARALQKPDQPQRELGEEDLVGIGYDRQSARRILELLSAQEQLAWYVNQGKKAGCYPITRVSDGYPLYLRRRLGMDSPGCLWAKGDETLLKERSFALVGSRELEVLNSAFAQEAGRQAALQGWVLVSGNARGADRTAQDSCLATGGSVISVVADELEKCQYRENVLYLSEDGFDLGFSAQRALSRNRVIHALGAFTLVAQCSAGKGGTWKGTTQNLKGNWSPVYCLDDASAACCQLEQLGASRINGSALLDLEGLIPEQIHFLDP